MELLIDYETRSRADLAAVGQHGYARHPTTEIMCLGWKIIGAPEAHIISMPGIYVPDHPEQKEFLYAVKHAETMIAHNAPFEQAIWNYTQVPGTALGYRTKHTTPKDWTCTMAMGSILALPRALEKAGYAMDLNIKKDMEGRRLLLSMCKPRRPINNIQKWIEWVEDDKNLKRLYDYCETDLWTEEEYYLAMKPYRPFTKKERAMWIMDQKINQRGFRIDVELAKAALEKITEHEKLLTKELHLKTFGMVKSVKQVKAMKDFLASQGVEISNLQKKTIDDILADTKAQERIGDQDVIDVLKIRQSLGKSSVTKYKSFLDRVDESDLRVRDNLLYHGASTGRWAGSGVQPQNFPRGTHKITEELITNIKNDSLELFTLEYGDPMRPLSSALRGVIVASPGKELFVGDFSSIEARVLLWVAGDKEGLAEYELGIDPYKAMAALIFGVKIENVTGDQRQLGKQVILACGYQMGLKKFNETTHANGLDLPEDLIKRAHEAFRKKYPKVPLVWFNYENAAIKAVQNPGKVITVNRVRWFMKGEFLFAELPSGRRLAYKSPSVRMEATPWGDDRPKLYHWGVDPKTKQWVESATYGGKLTENIVQAISRDCMAESMTRAEDVGGFTLLITVHDEIVSEGANKKLTDFINLMSARPDWGQDIPLKVEGWSGPRYRKG